MPYFPIMSTRIATELTSATEFSDIAQMLQMREEAWLDARAAKSHLSRGRARPENADDLRLEWQRDRDRILHCKAFRRLKHKTQVFVSPEHDHYRTRLTHTLEVAQIARTVSRALKLNEDLTEAIGLGHDLGHAPFGHVGEEALDAAYRKFDPNARFRHYEQSLRIVDKLEKHGDGLNLTWETRDGILHHSKGKSDLMIGESDGNDNEKPSDLPATLEGQVVRICDRVAYVNHDIDDATRAGLIRAEDLPRDCVHILGDTHAKRITTMIGAIIRASSVVRDNIEYSNLANDGNESTNSGVANENQSAISNAMNATNTNVANANDTNANDINVARANRFSANANSANANSANVNIEYSNGAAIRCVRERIAMSDDVMHATDHLKNWMFDHVYKLESVDETPRVMRVIAALFERFMEEPHLMKNMDVPQNATQPERARVVCDYIAGMTDRFASQTYLQLFMPSSWRGA